MQNKPRGRYRAYTDDERGGTLALLDANRGNFEQTAKQSGVPISTLKNWAEGVGVNEAVGQIWAQKREAIALRLDAKIDMLINAVDAPRIADAGLVAITTALGTLVDKAMYLHNETPLTREEAESMQAQWLHIVKQYVPEDRRDALADELARVTV